MHDTGRYVLELPSTSRRIDESPRVRIVRGSRKGSRLRRLRLTKQETTPNRPRDATNAAFSRLQRLLLLSARQTHLYLQAHVPGSSLKSERPRPSERYMLCAVKSLNHGHFRKSVRPAS